MSVNDRYFTPVKTKHPTTGIDSQLLTLSASVTGLRNHNHVLEAKLAQQVPLSLVQELLSLIPASEANNPCVLEAKKYV